MIITKRAYPRGGLVGNPSDGYFGKTIALSFRNFHAEVVLYETPALEILPNTRDHSRFRSIEALADDVKLYGYYGGIRLVKAAIRCFFRYCSKTGVTLHDRNFTVKYHSTIPHLVGLAGSSAIITACMRALMAFYGVSIPKPVLANLILSVECDELGISAGLQDRVAQVYQGMVYMDFDRDLMQTRGYGRYDTLDTAGLPPLYIAYRSDLSQGSEVFHNNIRGRFERGDSDVVDAMLFWADLTDQVRRLLEAGQGDRIGTLLNANFDRRRELYEISEGNLQMIDTARGLGASAKFTGSGGAIIGTYEDEAMFKELRQALTAMQIKVMKPRFVDPSGDQDA